MSNIPMDALPASRRPWLPTLLVGALGVLAMGGTALLNPFRAAIGSGASEAPGHLFGLWAVARNILESGPLVRMAEVGFPDHFQAHLMDPINMVLFLPVYLLFGGGALGATVAWNALHLGAVAIGAWGCWKLAQRVIGDVPALPWASALMAAVFCLSPYMLYVPFAGRTEYLPAVLYPLHLALLHRWLRAPVGLEGERGEAPPLWVGLLAGLVLGASALGGWYLAVFLGLAEIPVAIWLAWGIRWKEALWRLLLVAVVGVLCVLPAAWALVRFPPDKGSVMINMGMEVTPLTFPTDALPVLFRAQTMDVVNRWMDQPAYIGVVAVAVGLLGVLLRPRRAIWALLALWLLSFGPGPFLVWSEAPLDESTAHLASPFSGYYLLDLIPPLRAMRTWSRIAVLASLPAGVAVAVTYAAITARMSAGAARNFALVLLGALLLDQATYPVRWSPVRPWFNATPPEELIRGLEILPEGAILQLPVDIPLRTGGGPEERGHYLLWHLAHGRPVTATPLGVMDGTLRSSTLSRLAVVREVVGVSLRGGSLDPNATPRSAYPAPTDEEIACIRKDVVKLRDNGIVGVVLHDDRAGSSELRPLLKDALGDPAFDERTVSIWPLEDTPEPEGEQTCTLPTLPPHLSRRVDRVLFGG